MAAESSKLLRPLRRSQNRKFPKERASQVKSRLLPAPAAASDAPRHSLSRQRARTSPRRTFVNTSSGAGVSAIRGQSSYCAAKFGVIALTKSAALDYAPDGIRISAICPGIIETPMVDRFTGGTKDGRARVIAQEPVGRMGRVEEVAGAVLYLCSEEAGLVTGHAMVNDGGQTAGF